MASERIETPADAVARLCALQKEVVDAVFGYDAPNDCFCRDPERGGSNWSLDSFRHSGQSIRFIEEAVREKLAKLDPAATPKGGA